MNETYEPSADFVARTMAAVENIENTRQMRTVRFQAALESRAFAVAGGSAAGLLALLGVLRAWFMVLYPAVCH